MTAVYIDPLVGAALVHLGLRILPGLPCPTCGGRGFRRRRIGEACPACTDGVWTPPDSPVPIGVTSAEPRKGYLQASLAGWWLLGSDGRSWEIVLSSVIGEGTLRKLKVIDGERLDQDLTPELVCIDRLGLSHYGPLLSNCRDISSALPFLPGLKPGDTVYLLDGFTESVVCDGGRCGLSHRGCYPGDTSWCSSCDQMIPTERNGRFVTHWHRPMRRPCPFPVDAPDHPCVIVA